MQIPDRAMTVSTLNPVMSAMLTGWFDLVAFRANVFDWISGIAIAWKYCFPGRDRQFP